MRDPGWNRDSSECWGAQERQNGPLPGPLDTAWTEDWAGALQAEAAQGMLLARRTIKMEMPIQ